MRGALFRYETGTEKPRMDDAHRGDTRGAIVCHVAHPAFWKPSGMDLTVGPYG